MTKFMLGVAIGYVFSDIIDDLLGRASSLGQKAASIDEKLHTPPTEPTTPPSTTPPAA